MSGERDKNTCPGKQTKTQPYLLPHSAGTGAGIRFNTRLSCRSNGPISLRRTQAFARREPGGLAIQPWPVPLCLPQHSLRQSLPQVELGSRNFSSKGSSQLCRLGSQRYSQTGRCEHGRAALLNHGRPLDSTPMHHSIGAESPCVCLKLTWEGGKKCRVAGTTCSACVMGY